jgi:hypothetical protein
MNRSPVKAWLLLTLVVLYALVLPFACATGSDLSGGIGGAVATGGTAGAGGGCASDEQNCDGACVTLDDDPANCGQCGQTCAADEVCSLGACSAECAGTTTKCGASCVDTMSDPDNCGSCGTPCADGEVCSQGACALECAGGTTKCGAKCVDTAVDPANCGACGAFCVNGEVCSQSACALECAGGTTKCGAKCVDTNVDPTNCGGCSAPCPQGEVCSQGACGLQCGGGTTKCGTKCADTKNDPANCGACGVACASGKGCSNGACAVLMNGAACSNGPECVSGFCVDDVCCNTVCNTLCNACTSAKKGSGADGTCGTIGMNLDPDDECAGSLVCNGSSVCKAPNGDTCALGTECVSGFCADGVCCSAACTGPCLACTATKKGSGVNGVCGNIGAGLDPDNECFGGSSCSGSGACLLAANGTACTAGGECTSGFCVDGVCCNTVCNTLCNACTPAKKGSGADGTCGTIGMNLDPDDECAGSLVCNGSSVCKAPNGDACVLGTECVSGFCADGVCCSAACTGLCQACTATKKGSGVNGVCGNIAVGLDPDSECFGGSSCGGSGTCLLSANGTACTAGGECTSGFCIDGVCCSSVCNTLCNACTAAKRGSGADGTCGTIAANLDPDNECAGSLVCNGSSVCRAPNGDACVLGTECVSGFCADGVCCSAVCTGTCQACTAVKKGSGVNGVCGNIGAGLDPDNECFGGLSCSGTGACSLLANGTSCTNNGECTSGFCADGVCCSSVCNTLCNACTAAKKGSGADGTCGTIAANLDPDNECAGSLVCNGSSLCRAPNGDACVLGTECVSGFCADGVCCSAVCTGTCQACTAVKKGSGVNGVCGNIGVGLDPDNECFGGLSCSGAGACSLLANGTSCTNNGECTSGFCVDGVCCSSVCNTLCNACTAAKKGSGADGTCGTIAANLDPDNECAGSLVCNGSSVCRAPNGDACVLGTECVSGFCVDGVCCNAGCTGTCQACTAVKKGSGVNGVCGNIGVGLDPDNECFGGLSCSGAGTCSLLANGMSCTSNGECTSNFCVDGVCCSSVCNTLCNACTATKKNSGADGTCGAIAANLDPDNECAGATSCSGGSSCLLFTNGAACSINAECTSGNCVDGVCCNNACSGTCQACSTAKKGSGTNGTCGPIATSTDPDAECPGATTCNAVQACAVFPNGFACTIDAECSSGICTDGVCCNVACDGLCQACIGVKTNVSDGTCADVIVGTDPDNECSDLSSSPNCVGSLMCGP